MILGLGPGDPRVPTWRGSRPSDAGEGCKTTQNLILGGTLGLAWGGDWCLWGVLGLGLGGIDDARRGLGAFRSILVSFWRPSGAWKGRLGMPGGPSGAVTR